LPAGRKFGCITQEGPISKVCGAIKILGQFLAYICLEKAEKGLKLGDENVKRFFIPVSSFWPDF
jgi:hypothetical protein